MWERDGQQPLHKITARRGYNFVILQQRPPLKKTSIILTAPLKQRDVARGEEREKERVLKVQIVTVLCLLERNSITMCYLPVTCIDTHTHTHSTSAYFVVESSLLYNCVSPSSSSLTLAHTVVTSTVSL